MATEIKNNDKGDKKIEIAKQSPIGLESLGPKEIALLAVTSAIDQKGLDVRALNMRAVSDIADYFVIISATSERHAKGITDKILDRLKEKGERTLSIDGYESAEWILLDYGSVIIHVFYEPKRQYYSFDELWKDATEIEMDPELAKQAKKFRTGVVHFAKST